MSNAQVSAPNRNAVRWAEQVKCPGAPGLAGVTEQRDHVGAMRAMRMANQAARDAQPALNLAPVRVLMALEDIILSYGRLSDEVSASQIAGVAGMDTRQVR